MESFSKILVTKKDKSRSFSKSLVIFFNDKIIRRTIDFQHDKRHLTKQKPQTCFDFLCHLYGIYVTYLIYMFSVSKLKLK